MHADEYPMQFPWLGWALTNETLAAAETYDGPIFDLHRGLGPSAAKTPAGDNTQRLQGTLVGEILSLGIRETAGLIGTAIDVILLAGNDESAMWVHSTWTTIAASASAQVRLDWGWPFVQLRLTNTDGANAATVELMFKVRGHLRP